VGPWLPSEALVADESSVIKPIVGFRLDEGPNVMFSSGRELLVTEKISEVAVCGSEVQDGDVVEDVDYAEVDICWQVEKMRRQHTWRHDFAQSNSVGCFRTLFTR